MKLEPQFLDGSNHRLQYDRIRIGYANDDRFCGRRVGCENSLNPSKIIDEGMWRIPIGVDGCYRFIRKGDLVYAGK